MDPDTPPHRDPDPGTRPPSPAPGWAAPPTAPSHPAAPYPAAPYPAVSYPAAPGEAPSATAPAESPRASRTPVVIALSLAGVMLCLWGVVGFAVFDRFVKKDTGIAACEAIRDRRSTALGDRRLTEDEYRQLRAQFEDSRYEDIRAHGTRLVDLLWQVSQLPPGEEGGALALLGPLSRHATGLQSACADQGIIFNVTED